MTTTTTGLAAWLLERIGETQAEADLFHNYTECDKARHALDDPGFGWECTCGYPARVLALCAAHRRIVELHSPEVPGGEWCRVCDAEHGGKWEACVPEAVPCPTLRALATVYADAPGFREEWAL